MSLFERVSCFSEMFLKDHVLGIFLLLFAVYFPYEGAIERCGNETCQFGARCKHNQVEGTLKCSCDFFCDQEPKETVCGSDGNTYR